MFEKWRIKEHMEVVDSTGNHVGTVDEIEDNRIKLTRKDSADGSHHYVDIDSVDKIEDDRVYLDADTQLPSGWGGSGTGQYDMAGADRSGGESMSRGSVSGMGTSSGSGMGGGAGGGMSSGNTGGAGSSAGSDAANYGGSAGSGNLPGEENKLFGTSGTGTGMGGSGQGEH